VSRSLLAAFIIIAALIGCATEPEERRQEPAGPDPGLGMLRPATDPLPEPPPPSVKLVDLRRLRVGMTMEEVLAIFPGPDETRISPRDTIVWRYPFAELYFRDGRLYNWFDLEQEY
jgi:hypothetical protein